MKTSTNNLLFALSFIGALALFKILGAWDAPYLSTQFIAVPQQSRGNTHLSFTNRKSADHLYYSKNAGNLLEHVKKADILLLGNSRVLLGIDPQLVEAWSEEKGHSLYNFSFDHGEGYVFPLSIIQRHGLRPKYIIANLDTYFFSESIAPHGQSALASSAWDACKSWLNFPMATNLQGVLHKLIPKFRLLDKTPALAYRSKQNGCVYLHLPEELSAGFTHNKKGIQISQTELENARSLHDWCKTQNIRLFLIQVPNPSPANLDLDEFSERAGIPRISIQMDQADSFDNSHLTRESAKTFTRLFCSSLSQLVE